ncbi:MAG: hypothetical protein ABIG61_07925 [Planctomycetota bacterium]
MKKVIFLAVVCSLGAGDLIKAEYAKIGLDTHFEDWSPVTKVSDPVGDHQFDNDIVEVAAANDEINLFFYVRVSDVNGDQHGTQFGVPKKEVLRVFLDIDNNAATGELVGPVGAKIGAEYQISSSRKADPLSPSCSGDVYYWEDYFEEWMFAFRDTAGAPWGTILEGVNRIEVRAPYAGPYNVFLDLYSNPQLFLGDTIVYAVLANTTETDPNNPPQTIYTDNDWLDTPQTYTIVAGCGDQNHPYPQGDINKDCSVDFYDVAILSQDWVECTDPNGEACSDLR